MPEGTALAPVDVFRNDLVSNRSKFAALLPPNVPPEKFEQACMQAVMNNPDLLMVQKESLIKACMESAETGLSLNPTFRQADILVVNDRTKGKIAQFRPRYMGLMSLAKDSGDVIDISAHVVHENDEFDYEYGTDKKLKHKPKRTDAGNPTAAYCIWKTKDGVFDFEVMEAAEIEKIRKRSPAGRDGKGPWVTDTEEMWRKTAVRRASKYMNIKSPAFNRAIQYDDMADGSIIDGEAFEVPPAAELAKPEKPVTESVKGKGGKGGAKTKDDKPAGDNPGVVRSVALVDEVGEIISEHENERAWSDAFIALVNSKASPNACWRIGENNMSTIGNLPDGLMKDVQEAKDARVALLKKKQADAAVADQKKKQAAADQEAKKVKRTCCDSFEGEKHKFDCPSLNDPAGRSEPTDTTSTSTDDDAGDEPTLDLPSDDAGDGDESSVEQPADDEEAKQKEKDRIARGEKIAKMFIDAFGKMPSKAKLEELVKMPKNSRTIAELKDESPAIHERVQNAYKAHIGRLSGK